MSKVDKVIDDYIASFEAWEENELKQLDEIDGQIMSLQDQKERKKAMVDSRKDQMQIFIAIKQAISEDRAAQEENEREVSKLAEKFNAELPATFRQPFSEIMLRSGIEIEEIAEENKSSPDEEGVTPLANTG